MLYAEMGNRVIQISESQIELYNSKGYEIKDDKGAVVKATASQNLEALQKKYEEALEKIKALESEIATLKAKPKKVETKVGTAEAEKTTKKK